jgi:hypothetical protein
MAGLGFPSAPADPHVRGSPYVRPGASASFFEQRTPSSLDHCPERLHLLLDQLVEPPGYERVRVSEPIFSFACASPYRPFRIFMQCVPRKFELCVEPNRRWVVQRPR